MSRDHHDHATLYTNADLRDEARDERDEQLVHSKHRFRTHLFAGRRDFFALVDMRRSRDPPQHVLTTAFILIMCKPIGAALTSSCPNSCSGNGLCDATTLQCDCFDQWKGYNCATRSAQQDLLGFPHPTVQTMTSTAHLLHTCSSALELETASWVYANVLLRTQDQRVNAFSVRLHHQFLQRKWALHFTC